MRTSCFQCVMKHLGDAAMIEAEFHLGYPQNEVYVVGALSQAEQESFRLNRELAEAIREHRLRWQEDPINYDVPYEALGTYVRSCQDSSSGKFPALPDGCKVRIP